MAEVLTDTAPEVQTPPATQEAPPETSLSEHAAQFSPEAQRNAPPEPEANGTPPKQERHRAQSQKAKPDDAPRIAELTAKWRAAERERDELKAKYEASLRQVPTSTNGTQPSPRTTTQPQPIAAFPAFDAWLAENAGKDYEDYLDARTDWRTDQRTKAEQARAAETQSQQQAETQRRQVLEKHVERVAAFEAEHPDYVTVIQGLKDEAPPDLLFAAIAADDNGPAFIYHLAQHPLDRHELHVLTDGKAVTEQSVAYVRRLLTARVQAAQTGSAAAVPSYKPASRPPNPVRTGPMQTGSEPPGDGHSLAEHRKHYDPKRR